MERPLIALEEHYYSQAILDEVGPGFRQALERVPNLESRLCGIDDVRIASMDRGSVALQIVSHAFTPGGPSVSACHRGNDQLAADIGATRSTHPGRFAAFAVLPVASPQASAEELRRCVESLGFVGALIDNHAGGRHFDGDEYDVMWKVAEELDVPIYLHPTWPTDEWTKELFSGNFSSTTSGNLGTVGWGWHSDTGLHVLKLFAAGVFDKFPKLKIIIGHMGEMLPFMLERCMYMSTSFGGMGEHSRSLKTVWDENIWITTSGLWSLGPLKCLLHNTKLERILYSVDYPFEQNEKGLDWIGQLSASKLLTEEEIDKIGFRNAEALFNITVSPEQT